MHDLLIIGGGPAGLAAAAYGLGKQLDVVLLCAAFGGKAGAAALRRSGCAGAAEWSDRARALRGVAELLDRAAHVVLIAPFPGALSSTLGQRLRADPRVELLEGYRVTEVESSAGAVHAIQVAGNGHVQRVPVQAVFVDLGLVPNAQMVRQLV
jgi:thioredoxin reductase